MNNIKIQELPLVSMRCQSNRQCVFRLAFVWSLIVCWNHHNGVLFCFYFCFLFSFFDFVFECVCLGGLLFSSFVFKRCCLFCNIFEKTSNITLVFQRFWAKQDNRATFALACPARIAERQIVCFGAFFFLCFHWNPVARNSLLGNRPLTYCLPLISRC